MLLSNTTRTLLVYAYRRVSAAQNVWMHLLSQPFLSECDLRRKEIGDTELSAVILPNTKRVRSVCHLHQAKCKKSASVV
jgi:hypothetical protein